MTYPTIRPELTLDFANSRQLDPRITFSRSSSATYLNPDTGLITTASDHEARFEKEGLLIEESRTNSQEWSSDFSQTSSYGLINNGDGAVPVLDSTLYEAPDGSATAQRWTLQITDTTDAGNQSGIQAGTSGISAGAYVTVWAKSATGADQTVFLTSQSNDTFTVTSEWQRFDLGQRGTIPFRAFARGTYTNAVVDILLWGVQMEAGEFPTSYIPTAGSTVTRSVDIVQLTGTNATSWYNDAEGTFFYERVKQNTTEHQQEFWIRPLPSSGQNNISPVWKPNVITQLQYKTANVQQPASTVFDHADKVALALKDNDTVLAVGGVLGNVVTSNTLPGPVDYISVRYGSWIKRIAYYSRRLTDLELETITL